MHPTGGSLRVFRHFAWLEAGSVKVALSRPAHQRVTQAVGQTLMKKTLENPITFRPRRCRFCGKTRANFVPELNKGFAHWKCWKDYQSAQQAGAVDASPHAEKSNKLSGSRN